MLILLVIHLGPTDKQNALNGTNTVDFGLSVAGVKLGAAATDLASDIYIGGNIGPIDVVIANNGDIGVDAYFEVTHGGLDIDVLGVGVTNLTINDNSQPILTGAYQTELEGVADTATALQGALTANEVGNGGAGYDTTTIGAVVTGANNAVIAAQAAVDDTTDGGDPVVEGQALTDATTAAAGAAGLESALLIEAGYGSIANGVSTAGVNNMAYVAMTITTDAALYTGAAITEALVVTIDAMAMDIGMDVSIGKSDGLAANASIGHVAINDLNLTGTKLTIYGH